MVIIKITVIFFLLVSMCYEGTNCSPVEFEKPESRASLKARPFEVKDCKQHLSARTGFKCFAYMERYQWSNSKQQCILAIYGGCNPTKNNFFTLEECQKVATPICLNK
ncbi:kunitz-type serine protease inhibitor bitisilin-3-like [Diorhabda carinulata]|uniref:kunitz-type serine protease inhibitor bitisilin-3-like n=1 Tax=Diorhabda carinulata TaxID=1163345 RepID=UPI0025A2109A|nr:kunitz-type serine protease inhibitor bitisilin-3-like [Diorhabda carinulata]